MIPNSHKNLEMILIEKGSGNQLPQMMFINQCMTSIIIQQDFFGKPNLQQKIQGIDPISLCNPRADTDLQN